MDVLIAEDNFELCGLMSEILKSNGFTVDVAAEGGTACEKLNARKYDLIVLDLFLPEVDGFEILERKPQDRGPNESTPALAISGGGARVPGKFALDAASVLGANDVLYKPFSSTELINAVRGVLGMQSPDDHIPAYSRSN